LEGHVRNIFPPVVNGERVSASLEDVEVGLLRRQLLRLAGLVLVEAHDEWQVADKRYLSETSLALLR
jgi:hypothetical protein